MVLFDSTGDTAHLSSRNSVAGHGGMHTVAREYDCIWTGLHDRNHPRDRPGSHWRRPAGSDCHGDQHRNEGRPDDGQRRARAVSVRRSLPGTYDLKVELSGFKTYEQKALSLSPNDNRGIDVRLEIGQQTETVTVTSQLEVIQTETGAREGVLTAKQIDNLSIIGRSALELMRILPGVVTEFNVGESVSFGGGGNNTQGYTVNGIRSSGNTVSLDGSSLIDIGSNSGVIVSLNNDMISEVKVQSSNFAAEYGTGGMNVSGVTKSGSSAFHGSVYDYWRDHKFAANDRSNSIAGTQKPKSTYQYPGGNVGGPIVFGDSYTKSRDRLFFFVAYEAAAEGGLGLALHPHLQPGDAERRLQRAARQPGIEPEQHRAAADSERRSQCGAPARTTTWPHM